MFLPHEGPQLAEPSDAELCGLWPDPLAGRPDDADEWLASLSADELDAMFGATAEPDDREPGPGPLLDALEPGAGLAGVAADVFDGGLGRLSDDELVGLLGASRRLSSWQAAVEFFVVGELDGRRRREAQRPGWSGVSEHVSDELAMALTLTGRSADTLLGLSRELARIPMVLAALLAGRIDRARAVIFATELSGLSDIAACAVAAAFCGLAGSMTTGQLRAALRAMVLAVDPAAARRRAERARAEARVEAWQEGSGNAAIAGRELPAADALAADRRIAAIAAALKDAGAAGGMDQLRATVFTALLTGRDLESLLPADTSMTEGTSPSSSSGADEDADRRKAAGGKSLGLAGLVGSVNLTMPASTWLGLSQAPGEVTKLGPLDADSCRDLARRLASRPESRWCVTLTGPDDRAVAHACARAGPGMSRAAWLASLEFTWMQAGPCGHPLRTDGYRPRHKLRNLVKSRHRTCGFPGCRRPAVSCDDDHTIPYDQGGLTCECNLAPLCRRHHRAKQTPGWSLTQPSPGVLTWTTPHGGRTYTVTPSRYPV
ncbi:MAG TPA: HNH endonuclease signature motif containing protein [Streptosporangiaceae bacterium]